jgi:predicted GIY-YIG superfamily endonuclease
MDDWGFDLHALYRIYDPFGRPLYFGETDDLPRRLRQHMEKAWFRRPEITIKVTWFPNRAEALAAETAAIAAEKPWHNKSGLKAAPAIALPADKRQVTEEKQRSLDDRHQRVAEEKQRLAEEKRRIAEEEARIAEARERLIREQPPRDLLADISMVVRSERVRVRDVVGMLRGLAQSYVPYQKMTAVWLVAELKRAGVRTINTSGTFYLDPGDLRKVGAQGSQQLAG